MALALVQFNTHLFGGTIPGGFGPADLEFEDPERRDGIADKLKRRGPTVVCLNEVWADSYKDDLVAALARRYPAHFYPAKSDPLKLGSGLLLLTSFDIATADFTPFTDLRGFDRFSEKGFITATLAQAGTPVARVVLTHTQADDEPDDVKARWSNLEQIAARVAALPTDVPVVVAGDLNVIGETPRGTPTAEYTRMAGLFGPLGLADGYRAAHPQPRLHHGFTYNGYRNKLVRHFAPADATAQQRLDYVFSSLAPTRIDVSTTYTYNSPVLGGCDLSDHYPLVAEI